MLDLASSSADSRSVIFMSFSDGSDDCVTPEVAICTVTFYSGL